MIATPQHRLDIHRPRGMTPLTIRFLEVKCRLAADVWRLRSVAERPSGGPFAEVIMPVVLNDTDPRAVVPSSDHDDTRIGRMNDLETWVEELPNDRGGAA